MIRFVLLLASLATAPAFAKVGAPQFQRRVELDSKGGIQSGRLIQENTNGAIQEGAVPNPNCESERYNSENLSMWSAAESVMKEGIIPPKSGYSLNARGWPELVKKDGKLTVNFGPGKQSMCTSASATVFMKHIADLQNAGAFQLSDEQLAYLNRSWRNGSKADDQQVKNALNGDTNSTAMLYQYLGGESVYGYKNGRSQAQILEALRQAKPGDSIKFDRAVGGHSATFKQLSGDQFCYFTSNMNTGGVSDSRCEPISALRSIVVSRFPKDVCSLPGKIDAMMRDAKISSVLGYNERKGVENSIPPNWIRWGFSDSQLASEEQKDMSGVQ